LNDLNPHCSPEPIFARKPIVERVCVWKLPLFLSDARSNHDHGATTQQTHGLATARTASKLNRKVKRGLKFRSRSKQQKTETVNVSISDRPRV